MNGLIKLVCLSLPSLFCLSSYVTSNPLAVVSQSGRKDQFYSTIYYIIVKFQEYLKVNKNAEAKVLVYLSFLLFKGKIIFKCHLIKSNYRVPRKNKEDTSFAPNYFTTFLEAKCAQIQKF
jgi:hypothetical protein